MRRGIGKLWEIVSFVRFTDEAAMLLAPISTQRNGLLEEIP